jgi:hypothetical protein
MGHRTARTNGLTMALNLISLHMEFVVALALPAAFIPATTALHHILLLEKWRIKTSSRPQKESRLQLIPHHLRSGGCHLGAG